MLERIKQCAFIDQWTSSNVDEVCVWLHFAQARGIHDAGCCRSHRRAEENIVSLRKNIVDLGAKKIYVYKDMKVTFTAGKVTDVQ